MILAYRHTGINVVNLERSVKFYTDMLGLDVIEERHEEGGYLDTLTGIEGARLDWVKVGAPNGVLLELVCWSSDVRLPDMRDYATVGINHLCFRVAGIDFLAQRLDAAGIRTHPVQTDPPGRVKNMVCYDPDGTIIELVEVL